jgi:transcriptional repressor NrdR
MDCPSCGKQTRVLESRGAEGGAAVRRRRECRSCGHRFTSFERAAPQALTVVKRDGSRRPFDGAKLRAGLLRATHKRPVGPDQIERLADRVAERIRAAGGELESSRIGELCLDGLRELDPGAYLQFAGVDLADPEAIRAELARLDRDAAPNGAENPANRGHAERGFRPRRVGSSAVTPQDRREERN